LSSKERAKSSTQNIIKNIANTHIREAAKEPTLKGEKLKKGMESKANLLMRKAQLIL